MYFMKTFDLLQAVRVSIVGNFLCPSTGITEAHPHEYVILIRMFHKILSSKILEMQEKQNKFG